MVFTQGRGFILGASLGLHNHSLRCAIWFATPRTPPLWQRGFFLVNCLVLRCLLASARSGVVKTFRCATRVVPCDFPAKFACVCSPIQNSCNGWERQRCKMKSTFRIGSKTVTAAEVFSASEPTHQEMAMFCDTLGSLIVNRVVLLKSILATSTTVSHPWLLYILARMNEKIRDCLLYTSPSPRDS